MHNVDHIRHQHRQLPLPGLEPTHISENRIPGPTLRALDRIEQLTLNTWRLAAAKLERVLDSTALLEHAAVYATLAALRDVDHPLLLFRRHAGAEREYALITSLIHATDETDLRYDILDAAFLLRWNELVAQGGGPEELPPLQRRATPLERATTVNHDS
jgi:hypothetical protein